MTAGLVLVAFTLSLLPFALLVSGLTWLSWFVYALAPHRSLLTAVRGKLAEHVAIRHQRADASLRAVVARARICTDLLCLKSAEGGRRDFVWRVPVRA